MLQITTIIFLISFSVLATIHIIAIELFLYWHFWWFDIFMHLFGGAIVALGLYTASDLRIFKRNRLSAKIVLGGVLLIALGWESFELLSGVPIESDFLLDTGTDLLVGLAGGYVGHIVGRSLGNV